MKLIMSEKKKNFYILLYVKYEEQLWTHISALSLLFWKYRGNRSWLVSIA
jgi:hypothetical protein